MNTKMKKRMIVVGGIIVIAIILLLAFVGAGNNAKVVSVAEAADGSYEGAKVQVTGTVVDNSYSVDGDGVLTFSIQDKDDPSATMAISYDKGVSATFGNGIEAICTGRMQGSELVCTELVTKCPSKYENATEALSISELLSYDLEKMVGNTVKVAGSVQAGSIKDATADVRLIIEDTDEDIALNIVYGGALSDDVKDGASVIISGALQADGTFKATEVALEG